MNIKHIISVTIRVILSVLYFMEEGLGTFSMRMNNGESLPLAILELVGSTCFIYLFMELLISVLCETKSIIITFETFIGFALLMCLFNAKALAFFLNIVSIIVFIQMFLIDISKCFKRRPFIRENKNSFESNPDTSSPYHNLKDDPWSDIYEDKE